MGPHTLWIIYAAGTGVVSLALWIVYSSFGELNALVKEYARA
jgi:hypothetical protein